MDNQLNNTTLLNIYVTCWKDSNATYFPNGVPRMINANLQREGDYGVNIRGEVFPVPTSTQVPPAAGTDFQQQTALVQEGNIYKKPYPFATSDPSFKICVRVKDLSTGITYYLDAADYAAKVAGLNPVPYYT